MKIDIENVEAILLERKVDAIKVQEIIKYLVKAVEEEKADAIVSNGPKPKWEYVVVINDPEGKITKDFTAWVVQQKEGQDTGLVLGKLADAAKAQNESAKKKKTLIKSFVELFEGLKAKWTKEKGVRIKTKSPVRVLIVNGKTL